MAQHVDGGFSPGTFGPGPDKCPEGGLVAWDNVTEACFDIYGLGITIGSQVASNEGGFAVFNLNVHRDGKRGLVNSTQLRIAGPVAV